MKINFLQNSSGVLFIGDRIYIYICMCVCVCVCVNKYV